MDSSITYKQVKKVPKTHGYNKKLNESVVIETDNVVDSNTQKIYKDEDRVLNAFEFFDLNKNGTITCREYFSILLGTQQFTEEEIQKILDSSNLNINGVVDYKKFYQFWNNK